MGVAHRQSCGASTSGDRGILPNVRCETGGVSPTVLPCAKLRPRGRPLMPWINGVSSFRCSPRSSMDSCSREHRALPEPFLRGVCRSRRYRWRAQSCSISGASNSQFQTSSSPLSPGTPGADTFRLAAPSAAADCMACPTSAHGPRSWRLWLPAVPLPSLCPPPPGPRRPPVRKFSSLEPTRLRSGIFHPSPRSHRRSRTPRPDRLRTPRPDRLRTRHPDRLRTRHPDRLRTRHLDRLRTRHLDRRRIRHLDRRRIRHLNRHRARPRPPKQSRSSLCRTSRRRPYPRRAHSRLG